MIDQIARHIDARLSDTSGKVFYSGRAAFASPRCVYVVGINPGGDPETQANETVGAHTRFVLSKAPDDWSAYVDEDWEGRGPNFQRRMRYLFEKLSLNPRRVASSNLIFTRSRRIANLGAQRDLTEMCWPVHAAVLELLKPRATICLGELPGKEFKRRMGANHLVKTFEERYDNRSANSSAWRSPSGDIVFQLTHPTFADWTNQDADPSDMVRSVLAAC